MELCNQCKEHAKKYHSTMLCKECDEKARREIIIMTDENNKLKCEFDNGKMR